MPLHTVINYNGQFSGNDGIHFRWEERLVNEYIDKIKPVGDIESVEDPWTFAMKIVKESKILIVPSRTESIPQVIKEAFFLEVPVIATNVGGIPELISDGNTGLLVSPETPQEMASTINTLLDDDETQQKLSKNAFDFINKNF